MQRLDRRVLGFEMKVSGLRKPCEHAIPWVEEEV